MNFFKGLIASAAIIAGSGAVLAGDTKVQVIPDKAKSATVVTACQQIIVVVLVSPTGDVYVVDKDTGVPAGVVKAIAEDAEQTIVYDVGCPSNIIRT